MMKTKLSETSPGGSELTGVLRRGVGVGETEAAALGKTRAQAPRADLRQ